MTAGRNTHRAPCQVPMEHTGLHLRLVGPQAGQRATSQDEVSHTNLQIFSGGTQKRKARGAYQGPYEGLKDLVLRGKNVLTYRMPTGNPNAVITLLLSMTACRRSKRQQLCRLVGRPMEYKLRFRWKLSRRFSSDLSWT